jgi:hypothetical protein
MRILFLTSAHNSLSQRLWIELCERGHDIRVMVRLLSLTIIVRSALSPFQARLGSYRIKE